LADLSLTKLPWKVQLGVFFALAFAGAAAFYYFYETPAQERMAMRQQELDGLNKTIDKGRATARQLAEFQREVGNLQVRLESLKPILPDEKDAADLLRRVNTLALQSSLRIKGFKPKAIATKQIHAEWPITLELEGTYHDLGTFLDRVSKFPRIINVGGLEIKGKTGATPNSTIEVTCTATTFVLLDPSAAPAKKSDAAAKKTE
jgi:type IV pilus assembly protein PilO